MQLGWRLLKSTPKCHSYRLQWIELLVDLRSEVFVESAQCILPLPPHPAQSQHKRMQLHSVWLTWQNCSHVPMSESDQIHTAGWLRQCTALILMLEEPSIRSPCSYPGFDMNLFAAFLDLMKDLSICSSQWDQILYIYIRYCLCLEPCFSYTWYLSQWQYPSYLHRSIKISCVTFKSVQYHLVPAPVFCGLSGLKRLLVAWYSMK